MEVHFPPETEAKVTRSAAQQGRAPDEIAPVIVTRYFEEETRFVEAVKRGEYLTHEQVGQRLQAPLAALRYIRWSEPAADDLERICERIEGDNPDAAGRMAGRRELVFQAVLNSAASFLFRRKRKRHIALRNSRRRYTAGWNVRPGRISVSAGDRHQNVLAPVHLVNRRDAERAVRQFLAENQLSRVFVERVEL